MRPHIAYQLWCLFALILSACAEDEEPKMSDERCVIQTSYGDVEFGFWPEVAPITSKHVHRLLSLGVYNTNHFFRVHKGFVVQTADASSGRTVPLNAQQRKYASDLVPLEVKKGVNHHAGVLSMARGGDPNSGGGSFFIMLGDAPHLDMGYGAFGKVTSGMEVLHKLEELETKTEGIFLMPKDRISFLSTYCYSVANGPEVHIGGVTTSKDARGELAELKARFDSQAEELERMRIKCLPV